MINGIFENAKWITGNNEVSNNSILLRKKINILKVVKSATLYVCGLGYGEYTINAKPVSGDVLSTPFTKYDSRVLYLTYSVTNLINIGENTIGVMLGNGWYNDVCKTWEFDTASWRDCVKMIMQLDVTYYDESRESFISDNLWKYSSSPIIYNHMREGEIYDARLEQEGWNTNGFDDSAWEYAHLTSGSGGVFMPADLPSIRVIKNLKATYLGNSVYDFGENTSGWVNISVSGEKGHEIVIHYAEKYHDGDIDNKNINKFNKNNLKHCDKYILKGNGFEQWHPRFVYHAFRYVKVENAPKDFEIYAEVVHTDLKSIGEFECGDEILNKIHEATIRSTLTNFHSIPTDCPHREQNGWTGDALISAQQALMNFDMVKSYKKWLCDFKDVQRPDGQLPGIIPTSSWGYNWGSGPAWDSSLIMIPWYVYQNTKDTLIIKQMWVNMKLYMEYIKRRSMDYIVNFGLGDWCPPANAAICPIEVTDTAYYYVNAKTMAKCAEIMGEDSMCYEKLSEDIKEAYRNKFLNNSELEKSQTFLACGIYQGLYNKDEIPHKAKLLAELVKNKNYHIDCGILGTKYIFSALSENGYADVLYKMVTNPTMPSYAYWISQGMTTLCENWNMTESCNHHMFSEVDNWFYKYLAGIQIDENGIKIKPCILPQIKWVKAKHRDIEVKWNEKELYVKVPCKTQVIIKKKVYKVNNGEHVFNIIDQP